MSTPLSTEEALVLLDQVRDPRFDEPRARLARAIGEPAVTINGSDRAVPVNELLDIYRTRLEILEARGKTVVGMAALVEMFARNQGSSWKLFSVSRAGGLVGALFVSATSGEAGCVVLPPEGEVPSD